MSKLEELIQELCPDGVEYKTLDDLFVLKNGYTPSKKNDEYWHNGTVPWFRLEDIRTNGRVLSDAKQHVTSKAVKGSLFPANSIIVSTTATIGEHALIESPFLINQQLTCVSVKEQFKAQINIKFVFYYFEILKEDLKRIASQSGNMPIVSLAKMKQLLMPLPPLEVQQEIVRLLDDFTAKTAELQAELNKEYEARKKQYEYYRDELLTFGDEIEWKTLDGKNGIAVIKGGKDYKHLGEGTVPIYGSGGIMGSCDTSIYNKPTVLIPRKGSISNIFYVDGPFWNVDTIFYTEINDNVIMPKFLFHWICNYHVEKLNTSNAARPALTREILKGIPVPIPSMEEQQKIVRALDTFENVCTDMFAGLPAEIEARQKQYEYYRDQLLTFKELK